MQIVGTYIRTLYRDFKTGYASFLLKPDDLYLSITDGNLLKCNGIAPRYGEKTKIVIEADVFISNGFYFAELKRTDIYLATNENILSFLANMPKTGIGKSKFKTLISKFGMRIITDIHQEEFLKELSEERGMSEEKTLALKRGICNFLETKEIVDRFGMYGIYYKTANKIHAVFGGLSISRISDNPYCLTDHKLASFSTCDLIARDLGYAYHDIRRTEYIVKTAIRSLKQEESCVHSYEFIKKRIRKIEMQTSAFDEWMPEASMVLEIAKAEHLKSFDKNGKFYFMEKSVHFTEERICANLMRLVRESVPLLTDNQIEESRLAKHDVQLDDSQLNALSMLKNSKPSILTGGPGTGKTTIIKKIVATVLKNSPEAKIGLCALAGRAAKRINESTGYPASTIHKLLEYEADWTGKAKAGRDENNFLDYDYIIVDEFSMVGIFLFASLLRAVESGKKVILVGDINQLDSIEPGAIMRDMIESDLFEVYRLTNTHRQKDGNTIIENAKIISNLQSNLATDGDFQIMEYASEEEILEKCVDLSREYYDRINVHKFHIIAPVKRGTCGVNEINKAVQAALHGENESCYQYGHDRYYMNDKVIMIRNNYDDLNTYYNGDIGTVNNWSDKGVTSEIDGENKFVQTENLDDISLAYAMTVHKCQGSEADIVALVLTQEMSDFMKKNSIVYTAITRAKKKMIILTTPNTLQEAIENKGTYRETTLLERLKSCRS